MNLGIDAKKSDQVVRGSALLPHGTGKVVRVAVFAQGQNAEKAKAAGADVVGFEDLAEQMKGGEIDFDTVIATPDAMRIVGQLGPGSGSAWPDAEPQGRNGYPGCRDGRAVMPRLVRSVTVPTKAASCIARSARPDFEVAALRDNLLALLNDIKKVKPPAAKGQYLKRLTVSSTMGPGVMIDQASLDI